MKASKYIITFIFMFFFFIFSAESRWLCITNFLFQTNSIYYDIEIHDDKDIGLLNTIANDNKLIICIADINKDYLKQTNDIYIYTNANKNDLEKNFQVLQGEYKSLLINNVCIKVLPLSQYEIKEETRLFTYGSEQSQITFRQSLEENFHIIKGNITSNFKIGSFNLVLYVIQGIIIVFIFVLTLFSVISERKDHFIKIVNGESITAIIIKNIIKEVFILSLQIAFIYYYLDFNDRMYFTHIDKYFVGLIVSSCIFPYFILLKFDYKHIINEQITLNKLLKFSYIYKTILMTLMITICVLVSKTSINFITEYKYYESAKQFNNYIALQIRVKDLDPVDDFENFVSETNQKIEEMYVELYYSNSPTISEYLNDNIIYCNANFKSCLLDLLGDINIKDKGYFLIIPEEKNIEDLKKQARNTINQIEGIETNDDIEIVVYNKSVDIISFSHDIDFPIEITHNPYIIFNNNEPIFNNTNLKDSQKIIINTILFENNENLTEYINDNDSVDYNEINIGENIKYYLSKNKNICLALFLTSIAFILLILIINTYIMKMEYRINSKEYCLKKILGYTTIQKFGGNIFMSALSIFFSGIISFSIFEKNYISSIVIIGLCLLTFIFDIILICFYSLKIENKNIIKCLKGEAM